MTRGGGVLSPKDCVLDSVDSSRVITVFLRVIFWVSFSTLLVKVRAKELTLLEVPVEDEYDEEEASESVSINGRDCTSLFFDVEGRSRKD